MAKPESPEGTKLVAKNKKAYFNYFVEEKVEAGLVLSGSEVKSLRAGKANLSDAYALPKGPELFLVNCNIASYDPAAMLGHEPLRSRKLLLHRQEIDRLLAKVAEKGLTLIPLALYFKNGRAKVEVGLCKGKQGADKRDAIAKREGKREIDRAMKTRRR